jgi:hypothetical protein
LRYHGIALTALPKAHNMKESPMSAQAIDMSRIFPSTDDQLETASSVRLPKKLWTGLDAVAAHETAKRRGQNPKATQVSRNDAIRHMLEWAIDTYWADESGPSGENARALAEAQATADAEERAASAVQRQKRPAR